MKHNFNKIKNTIVVMGLLTAVFISSCTKVERDDDFPIGVPPPLSGGYTYSSDVAKSNLVAYWAFNGSLIDSVSGNSATNSGATFEEGKKGLGYKGGSAAYATFDPGPALQGLKSYTISFWIFSTVNSGAVGIFTLARTDDFWGSIDIYQDGSAVADTAIFKVHMYNSAVPWAGQFTDTKVNINRWMHLTATYDAATSKFNIYQNGSAIKVNTAGNDQGIINPTLHGSDPLAPPETPYGNLVLINATKGAFGAFQFQTNPSLTNGATAQSWATNFTGKLDEFRIYDRALTGQEVSALFQLEKQGR